MSPHLSGAVGWPPAFAERYRALGLWRGQSLGAWFEELCQRFASQLALIDGELRLDYAALGRRVRRLARGFAELGLQPFDRAVLQLPNGVDAVETLLALTSLGVVPVLALPAHRRLELESFCRRSGAVALVMAPRQGAADLRPLAEELRQTCPELRHVVMNGAVPVPGCVLLAELRDAQGSVVPPFTDASQVALLQLSGGSSGVPKLIARTHDDYLYSVRESAAVCRLSEATRFLAALPLTHNFTLSSPGVLGVLHVGGAVVTCAHPSPELVLELLVKEKITLVAAVPSLVRSWLASSERHLGTRQLPELVLQVGGAKLDEPLARKVVSSWGCQLQQVFGMAEGLVNYTRPGDALELVCTTQGRPLSVHDEIRVVAPEDPQGRALEPSRLGELQTRGPYTIRGYFGVDPSPDSFTPDGFYRTGDLVRLRPDGYLVVEGRLGDRILRGGEKIAPLEIEDQLRLHPAVLDAAVVGIPDEYLGQKSHAFVVLRAGASLSTAEARRFLRTRGLADFKLPDALHVLGELPRTKVGKLDRAQLRSAPLDPPT